VSGRPGQRLDQFLQGGQLLEGEDQPQNPFAPLGLDHPRRQAPKLLHHGGVGERLEGGPGRRQRRLQDRAVREGDPQTGLSSPQRTGGVEGGIVMGLDPGYQGPHIVGVDASRGKLLDQGRTVQHRHGQHIGHIHLGAGGRERTLGKPPAVVVHGVGKMDVDLLDLVSHYKTLGVDLPQGIERRVQTTHGGIGLDHDAFGLPPRPELGGDLADVGVVTLAERGQEAA
jgi:hypothetical protein